MADREPREPIEVRLTLDDDGVAVRVLHSHGDRLADAYRAGAASIQDPQAEVTAHYRDYGYKADGGWRPQRWTTTHTGYGEIIHESSCTFR